MAANNPGSSNDVMTYEGVLNAVQQGQNPSTIAVRLQIFLQHNPNLSEAANLALDHGTKRMRLDLDQGIQNELSTSANVASTSTGAQAAGGEGASVGGGKRKKRGKQNPADVGVDVSNIIHSQETLIQSLLPSEQFLRILAVRDKFAERANTAIGCLMAYRILGDTENRVHIDEIAQILGSSVKFKHRPVSIAIANFLPILEERDVDEDVFGEWLEDMENWNEPLPFLQALIKKQKSVMDTIKLTLQTGPPLDSSIGYRYRDMIVKPEQIAQLLNGLDQREFGEIIRGMFVNFDFYGLKYTIATVNAKTNKRGSKNLNCGRRYQFLPICNVTFDATTATPVPFSPTNN